MLASRSIRSGLTMVEVIVVLTIAAIVLALVASIALRQQRVFADLAEQSALAGQLREASAVLPIDVRALTPSAGDVREARDTAFEIRSTIASAIVCDTAPSTLVLAPVANGDVYSSYHVTLEAGDSLWSLEDSGGGDAWRGRRIITVANRPAGACASLAPVLTAAGLAGSRVALTLEPSIPPHATPPPGTPVRVTRPARFSIYRASDSQWYLGEREWSNSGSRLTTIQPVAGPFLTASAGGVVFRYADSLRRALSSPVGDPTTIAFVSVALRGQTRNATRVLGSARSGGSHVDSSIIAITLRNRQ